MNYYYFTHVYNLSWLPFDIFEILAVKVTS